MATPTTAQIDALPISPEAKAGLYAKYGLTVDVGQDAPPDPTVIDFGPKAPAAPAPVTATPGGQALSSGFAKDPREEYMAKMAGVTSGWTSEDGVPGSPVPAPPLPAAPPKPAAPPPVAGPVPSGAPLPIPGGLPKPGAPQPLASGMSATPAPTFDPFKFGKTPGQQKMDAITGHAMLGDAGYAEQASAIDTGLAEQDADFSAKIAQEADAQAAAVAKKAEERKAFLGKFNADTQKAIDKYVSAEVDPGRFWAGSHGTANAIGATIGMFFAGIAGALDPSKDYVNQTMGRIEGKIQQDIDLQKAQIAKQGAGIEARRGLYASYLQQFGQEDAADAMAHAAYLRKTKAQVDAYAAKATSGKAKLGAQALSAKLEEQYNMWRAGVQTGGEKLYADWQKQMALAASAGQAELKKRNDAIFKAQLDVGTERAKKIGGTVMPLSSPMKLSTGAVIPAGSVVVLDSKGQIDMEGTAAAEKAGKVTGVNIPFMQPDGSIKYQVAPVPEGSAKDVQKQAAGAAKALTALDRMGKAADMPGPWTGKKKAEYEAALADYTTYYAVANDMGAVSEAEGERIAKTTVPLPTWGVGYMTDAERAKIDAAKVSIQKSVGAVASAYGTPGSGGGGAALPIKPIE